MSMISAPAAITPHRYSLKNKFIKMFRPQADSSTLDKSSQHPVKQRKSTPAAKKLTRHRHYGDGTIKSGSFDDGYHYKSVNISPCVQRSSRSRDGRSNSCKTSTLPVGKSLKECYTNYLDTSYDRAVEEDRRGSVPSVTLTGPTFSLSPGDDASTTASAAQSDKQSIASTSDSKSRKGGGSFKSQFIRRARSITKLDKKRNNTSPSLSSKASGSVQDVSGGWSYMSPSHSLPAAPHNLDHSLDTNSLSSNTLPSYRCATNNTPVLEATANPRTESPSVLGRLKRSLSLTRLSNRKNSRSRTRISQSNHNLARNGDGNSSSPTVSQKHGDSNKPHAK